MPAFNPIQTNFTSGELSPRLHGRVDIEQYRNGAKEITNFLVMPAGGATKRPGATFVWITKVSTGRVRLVPFVASNNAAYVLEFGAGYVRFYRNRGLLTASGTPLELATPYTLDQLRALRFAQSADVLTICHVAHQPREISRTAADAFQIGLVAFEDGPYDAENIGDPGATGAAPSATSPPDGTDGGSVGGGGSGSGGAPTGNAGGEGGADGGEGEGEGEGESGGGVGEA